MNPLHPHQQAAAAIKPLAVGLVVSLLTIPAVLIISGEVGAP